MTGPRDPTAPPPRGVPPRLRAAEGHRAFRFGFREHPLLIDTPAYQGPATPASLDGVLWIDETGE